MSHIVTVKTKVTDTRALVEAAERMEGVRVLGEGSHRLYQGAVDGLGIQLPGWNYPVVVKEDGTVVYDNYNGYWGDIDRLDELMQAYTVEKVKSEAALAGRFVDETVCENGDVVLRIEY